MFCERTSGSVARHTVNGRRRRIPGDGDGTQVRRLPTNVVRAIERATNRRLRDLVDADRAAGRKWGKIAARLNDATGGRFALTAEEIRRFAVESGIELAPGPRRQRTEDVGAAHTPNAALKDMKRRDPAPARRLTQSAQRLTPAAGTVAHATAALRAAFTRAGALPTRIERSRVERYLSELDDAERQELLTELLLAKFRRATPVVEDTSSRSSSVRTVGGGLPSLGRR